jgi:hypothetical protein
VAGVKLQFEVQLADIESPIYFAWRSIIGIPNRGSYTLIPPDDGTKLRFNLLF